ncbi:MAG: hypothetical protein II297_02060 [Clostridia bacterium]|nr:hypothetical protein [Clostridia bacterium]
MAARKIGLVIFIIDYAMRSSCSDAHTVFGLDAVVSIYQIRRNPTEEHIDALPRWSRLW